MDTEMPFLLLQHRSTTDVSIVSSHLAGDSNASAAGSRECLNSHDLEVEVAIAETVLGPVVELRDTFSKPTIRLNTQQCKLTWLAMVTVPLWRWL